MTVFSLHELSPVSPWTSACFSGVFIAAEANGCTHSRLGPSSEWIPKWGVSEKELNLAASLLSPLWGPDLHLPSKSSFCPTGPELPTDRKFAAYCVFFSCHWNVLSVVLSTGHKDFLNGQKGQHLLRAAMPAANENLGRKGKIIEPSNAKLFPKDPLCSPHAPFCCGFPRPAGCSLIHPLHRRDT